MKKRINTYQKYIAQSEAKVPMIRYTAKLSPLGDNPLPVEGVEIKKVFYYLDDFESEESRLDEVREEVKRTLMGRFRSELRNGLFYPAKYKGVTLDGNYGMRIQKEELTK